MTTAIGLPLSSLIAISATLTPNGINTPNFNTALILGTSTVIDVVTRMRTYANLTGVATDFGTSAPEYLAAQEWFSQNPQPTSLCIGRWANAATNGQLYGGSVTPTNQAIATWNAVTTGAFTVSINASAQTITGLNFGASSNLNGVAAVIQAALRAIASGGYTLATCVWNPSYQRFTITSGTTGTSSAVSFLTTPGSGTDISTMLAMQSTNGGYVANGIAAETALAAVVILDNLYSSQWYGLVVLGEADSDAQAIAPYIEAASIAPHYFGVNTQESAVLNPVDTTNIAYLLKQTGYNHTAVQYSSTSLYAVVSFLARILTTQWAAQNSAITLAYKQEPGVAPETINTTQMSALLGFNANVYVNYNTSPTAAIIQPGVATSGIFVDSVIGVDVLSYTMQAALFNQLFTTPTKIPQTDAGMHVLNTGISGTCQQFVNNGLLGPGVWNAPGFGQLVQGQFLPNGYYVYQPPIATQSQASRTVRASVPFQVAAKLAGAVQSVSVSINVNS